ncbi:MAG: gfo/Idh/MocA family oxidoreductase [Acholeplasma sp.]|nr:MAG: gfo/Idh/MocA family oxidoreductase [Acholeplasma sp.]
MMNKVRVGVLGIGRGSSMINYAKKAGNAELVAICDYYEKGLNELKTQLNDPKITYYHSYDEFLNHPMDAVVLANYATEHAPFAIKALKKGLHVFSEVLPVQTLKEAVELVEAIEESKLIYAYGENYCYMPAPREMKRLFEAGKLGTFEYGEAEYIHNCESIWADITYGHKDHWRNRMYATFYATHSIGPLIHITKLRPVSVIGFEIPYSSRAKRMGKLGATAGIEMITLENGAIIKSIHGDLAKNSIWFSIYGSKGRMESAREDSLTQDVERIYLNLDQDEGSDDSQVVTYEPKETFHEIAKDFGHGGSDYYTMYHFIEKVLGHEADIIDIYEALDMFLPGLYAYRSILDGNKPKIIPNLRIKEEREKVRNDIACTDPLVAKDQLIPCYSKGNPEIPDFVYQKLLEKSRSKK